MELTINKKRMIQAIEELPENATIEQAMYKLYVLDQISKSLADTGKKVPHDEVKERLLNKS
ncbi:MAG: hypothetical protein WEA56_06735 [Balneolaceae bacterium]